MKDNRKFSELEYVRVDIELAIKETKDNILRLKEAHSKEDAIEIIEKQQENANRYENMMSLSSIRYTINTSDQFYGDEEAYYSENKVRLSEVQVMFNEEIIKSKYLKDIEEYFGSIVTKNIQIAQKIISEKVISLMGEENKLQLEYQKVQSMMKVSFEGKQYSPSGMNVFLGKEDRNIRQEAYKALSKTYAANSEKLEQIYDDMIKVRTKIAKELGFKNFTELGYLRMFRNCYDRDMVKEFKEQVKTELVPLIQELKKEQARRIQVDKLKYYDEKLMCLTGNPKLEKTGEDLYQVGLKMFKDMSKETNGLASLMDEKEAFDLHIRENKMGGGYCSILPEYKLPFIFTNFNGTTDDVEVLTHEMGHALAFYFMMDKSPTILEAASPSMELCECHSKSMEYLVWPYFKEFFGDDSEKAKLTNLLGTLNFIPYTCMIDEFQHRIYDEPNLSKEERNQIWKQLEREYWPTVDYDNVNFYSEGKLWQRQLHVFTYPFYYIDYTLADVVALQIMQIMLEQGWEAAWEKYIKIIDLSGRKTFTEIIDEVGLQSPFKKGTLGNLIKTITKYVEDNKQNLE
ncbi:MAG: M3 family oligoendopeptidase [Filifactoraceae bacterium]